MRKYLASLPVFLAITFSLLPPWVNANDVTDRGTLSEESVKELLQFDLDQLFNYEVITPSKTPTPLFKTPGTVSVIGYKDIQQSTATTIPEMLRLIPGVNVRWNPMVQTIDIRGFGANPFTNRVLLMIDGIPYNSWNKGGFPQHPGFDFFGLENVKRIEVVRGSASALYGENALSGVINILTLSGEEFEQARAKFYAGDANHQSYSVTVGNKVNEDASYFASVRKSTQRLPTETWRNNDADADAIDLYLKGKYKDFQLSYFRRKDTFDGYTEPISGFPPGSAFRSADEIEQTINILAAKYNYDSNDGKLSVEANVSYSNRNGSHCAACHAEEQNEDFGESDEDHGYQRFANLQAHWRGVENHHILLGAEYRKIAAGDHVDELGTGEEHTYDIVTKYDKHALFLQDTWTLPGNRWQLVAGLRYDSETSPKLFNDEIFPRVDLIGQLTDKTVVRANWNQSTRYPSFSELYQNSWFFNVSNETFFPGNPAILAVFSPNPDLKPETIKNFGLGMTHRFSENLQLSADAYRYELEDPIIMAYGAPGPPGGAPGFIKFENHKDNARVTGLEVEVRAQPIAGLSTFLNWAYQNNSQRGNNLDSAGNPIEFAYAPKHKVNAGFTYTPRTEITITGDMSWRDEYTAPRFWYPIVLEQNNVSALDSYVYFNLRVNYKPQISVFGQNQPFTFSLVGKNLTDEEPYETLSGFGRSNPGREVFFSIQYALDY